MYTNDSIMEATTNVMDHLLAQNQMLREQNARMHSNLARLENERTEMSKYCRSINGLSEALTLLASRLESEEEKSSLLAARLESEEEKSSHIMDQLIMLQGQLAANNYISEKRQVSLPITSEKEKQKNKKTVTLIEDLTSAAPNSPSLGDLWCDEGESGKYWARVA